MPTKTPWSTIGLLTYKRTYSRRLDDDDPTKGTEDWPDTVDRVIDATDTQLGCGFSDKEKESLRDHMLALRGTVAGRFLWQLGTGTVDKLGMLSLKNCAACVVDEPIRPFTWAFDSLMLGVGVGFNIQREHVYELPKVLEYFKGPVRKDDESADFIVPDTRQGWVKLLEYTLRAAFDKESKRSFTYSTQLVRGAGAPIKTFGGVASGPEILCWGIDEISKVLETRANKKLRPVDCLDIMNIIGEIVVSGNVRRCLPEGSLVHTDRGLIRIEEIVPGKDRALTFDGYRTITNLLDQGVQKLLRIRTQAGSFTCTPNHRMAVLSDVYGGYTWKQASDLEEQDRLLFVSQPISGTATSLPPSEYERPALAYTARPMKVPDLSADTAWFLGYFQANGHVNLDSVISVCTPAQASDSVLVAVLEGMRSFGLIPTTRPGDGACHITKAASVETALWFQKNIKVSNETLVVPGFILEGTPEIRAAYLAGIMDGDGSTQTRPVFLMSCIHPEFLEQLQAVCASLGFVTRVSQNRPAKGNWKALYSIAIKGSKQEDVFASTVGRYLKYKDGQVRQRSREAEHNYTPVKVLSVEETQAQPTWDIEVEDRNEFYCNGYLVHNSAQLAIGDMDDFQYLRSKRWDLGKIPRWRSNSNNSVVCNDFSLLPDEIWKGYAGNGEPFGLINLKLARSCGRTGESKYKDKEVVAFNPCAEQPLANYEVCSLAEIFLPNIESSGQLYDVAKLLYRTNKHALALPCHHKETEEIVHKNMRMGIGVTGYLQATEEQRGWLGGCYEKLREYDKKYSADKGFPESIKLCTVKPSGTVSLLPGVTPGCHPGFSRYLIRRIRISADSPLVGVVRDHGYPVEYARGFDGEEDRRTVVASFPFSYPEGTTLAEEMSAIDQMEVVRRLQEEWSDNAVSCTVYYRIEELDEIKEYLKKNYNKNFKSLSFLLHKDHGFDQAPLEEITEEEYNKMVAKSRPIDNISTVVSDKLDSDNLECESGVCPVR